MTDDALVITVEAAARRLGMSRGAIYPPVMGGVIPSVKIGRARRIPVAALEAWIARKVRDEVPEPTGACAEK